MQRRNFTKALGLLAGLFALPRQVSAQSCEVKEYVALLTQSDIDAPVVSVKKNTLGGEVVWERVGTGIFRGTLEGAFPEADTVFNTQGFSLGRFDDPSVTLGMYCLDRADDNACLLLQNVAVIDGLTIPTCILEDYIFRPILIEIRVYPEP